MITIVEKITQQSGQYLPIIVSYHDHTSWRDKSQSPSIFISLSNCFLFIFSTAGVLLSLSQRWKWILVVQWRC